MGIDGKARRGGLGAEEIATADIWMPTEPDWGLGVAERLQLASKKVQDVCGAMQRIRRLLAYDIMPSSGDSA